MKPKRLLPAVRELYCLNFKPEQGDNGYEQAKSDDLPPCLVQTGDGVIFVGQYWKFVVCLSGKLRGKGREGDWIDEEKQWYFIAGERTSGEIWNRMFFQRGI